MAASLIPIVRFDAARRRAPARRGPPVRVHGDPRLPGRRARRGDERAVRRRWAAVLHVHSDAE